MHETLVEIILVNNQTNISTNISTYIKTIMSQLDIIIKGVSFQQDTQLR